MRDPLIRLRPGEEPDAAAVAQLHCSGISQGFLPHLGEDFLTRLYRRIVRFEGAFVIVADRQRQVLGFIAGTEAVPELYREFLLRDGMVAALKAAPRLLRGSRRMFETLSYGRDDPEGDDLPAAELLSIAVDSTVRGQGVGRHLVEAFVAELRRRQVPAAKVVVAADNHSAIALYRRCGFRSALVREIHRGAPSEVLVWP